MSSDAFLQQFGIRYPIIQAPMAGGPTTPELAAAVSEAGGLGSIGAAYLSPQQILETSQQIRKRTSRPFNINLFAGGYDLRTEIDAGPMLALLAEIHRSLELPPPSLPEVPPDPFPQQMEAVLDARPEVFSFTFGVPPPETMRRIRAAGIRVVGTATTLEEARILAASGVDAIVAQGAEAGGHRGTFAVPFEEALTPTMKLVQEIAAATSVPVIASGGLMDGKDVANAMACGAAAAQLGTAFLPCPESGASDAQKRAVLAAEGDPTSITRAFSGRPARGMQNRFMKLLEGRESWILPYPVQNALTRAMRTAAARRGDPEYLSLWAGTEVSRARALPARELVAVLVRELQGRGSG